MNIGRKATAEKQQLQTDDVQKRLPIPSIYEPVHLNKSKIQRDITICPIAQQSKK